jgi:peptidoglycan hydrolase CwlO-like protein
MELGRINDLMAQRDAIQREIEEKKKELANLKRSIEEKLEELASVEKALSSRKSS